MSTPDVEQPGVRNFLFLQGGSSPLFRKTGARLTRLGHTVHRINLCAGDWVFWPSGDNYRGRPADWPHFFETVVAQSGITDVVLLGEERPLHKAAVQICRRVGIEVFVVEMGYLRPDWLTLERGGMSTNSHFPNDPRQIMAAAAALPDPDFRPQFSQRFWVKALCDSAYALANIVFPFLYPHYRTHAINPPLAEFCGCLRKLAMSGRTRKQSARTMKMLLGEQFFLFPLQLETDYQVRAHSPFASQVQALEIVAGTFAGSADPGHLLVVKVHPLDNGLIDWARHCRRLAARFDLEDRLHILADGDLGQLLAQAKGVVTINSTVGIHALRAERPVKVLGTALYDVTGVTERKALSEFFRRPAPPERELRDALLRLMAATIQLRGNFHSRRGSDAAADTMAQRLHLRLVNQPGAFLPIAPRIGDKEKNKPR